MGQEAQEKGKLYTDENATNTFSVINNLPIGVFQLKLSVNGHLSFPYYSNKLVSILNVEPAHFDMLKLLENIHLEDLDYFRKSFEISTKKMAKWSVEFRILNKEGNFKWIFADSNPTKIEDGIIWNGYVQEITESKEIEQSNSIELERYHVIDKISNKGIWEIDLKTNENIWDEGVYKLFEVPNNSIFSPIEILKEKLSNEDFRELNNCIENSIKKNIDLDIEIKVFDRERNLKILNIKSKLLLNNSNKPYRFIGVVNDVTIQKNAEKIALNASELGEKNTKMNNAFLANMSHELKNPLNGVIGFIELLLKSKLDETQAQYINTVQKSTKSLLSVINDILDFSKIESGTLEPFYEEINIYNFSSKIIDVVKYQAHEKGIELILNISDSVPLNFKSDAVKIEQVLINLLGNAIKFTEKGEVELEINAIKLEENNERIIEFKVKDSGIGINQKNKEKIFEAFVQEDSSESRKFKGTGLGLTISKKLLQILNSKIELNTTLGSGSEFKFQIKSNENVDLAINWHSLNHFFKILIVDDNLRNRKILKELLPEKFFRIDEAKNGIEALEKLNENNKYDLILLDYHMPYIDGIETIINIRSRLKISNKELPIILMSNSNDDESLNYKCKEIGVNEILVKPFNKVQLIESMFKIQNEEIENKTDYNFNKNIESEVENINVLIVEDNETNVMLLNNILKAFISNINIQIATNGLEAISIFIKNKPDLIFMDIQMPEMNGYRAANEIRKFETDGKVPIIALTAGSIEGEKERCLNAGMDDFISKPIISKTIENCINKWFDSNDKIYFKKVNFVEIIKNKHFDLEKLLDRIENDAELLNQLMAMTSRYLIDFIPKLNELIINKDVNGVKSHIHKLKGTSLSVCFNQLANLSIEIEKLSDFNNYKYLNLKSLIKVEIDYLISMIENKDYLKSN
jgi:signal transduction histidine kinase/PleD family two-component response regulator